MPGPRVDRTGRVGRAGAAGLRDGDASVPVERSGGQQPCPAECRGPGRRQLGLDRAGRELERPVAAKVGRAGEIVARGDVGAGEVRELADEALAADRVRDVAAVQEQVAVGGERARPPGDCLRALVERRGVERGRAELDRAVAPVREDVHRGEPGARGERFADLRDPVAVRVEHDHVDRAVGAGRANEVGDERVAIGDRAVDEHELVRLDPHRDARRGIEGLERAMLGGEERRLGRNDVRDRREVGREQQPRLERFEHKLVARRAAAVWGLHLFAFP